MQNKKWTRRGFTKAVISAQALISSGALTLPLACDEITKSNVVNPLSLGAQKILTKATDIVIPANEKMPSASQVGSLSYILKILQELPELTPLFVSLTDKIDLQSEKELRTNFTDLSYEQGYKVLTFIEETEPELFKVLKDFTYESYYTNIEVYELINYDPYPTGSSGPEMEPFDKNLLDRVRTTPPFYIKI